MSTRRHKLLPRYVALLAAAILTLAACSSSSHHNSAPPTTADTNTSDSTTTSATTLNTSAATTTTTVLGPSGPAAGYPAAQANPPSLAGAYPVGTSVNLVTVIKTLTTYRDWVLSHPNPALAVNYMMTTGNDYTSEVQNLRSLQSKGWHEDPTPSVIQWAKVTRTPTASTYKVNGHPLFSGGSVTVVQVLTTAPYLNGAGQVVGHEPGGGPTAYLITLAQQTDGAQTPNGQFRILDVTQLNPPGGIASLEGQ